MNQNFIPPALYCPFPAAVSKHAETVQQQNIEWVRRFNLLKGEGAYKPLSAAKFGSLVSRTYPHAPLEELQIVTDWTVWMFILDDLSETLAKEPDSLAAMYSGFLDILKGVRAGEPENPLAVALQDIRSRLLQKATPAWMSRFIRTFEECCESWVWEARNLTNGTIPDVATYIQMRPFTGALMTVIEMIDITEGIDLSAEVRQHEAVQRLTLIANNVVNYPNDIFSVEKEIKAGEIHNLVLLLQREHQLSFQEAIDRAAEMHNSEVRAFIDLEKQLPSFGAQADWDLKRYLSALRFIMRGHLDWAQASGRYQPRATVIGLSAQIPA